VTDLSQIAAEINDNLKRLKEDQVKSDPENCQLFIYMTVIREGNRADDTVLVAHDKEKALKALAIAARGLDADIVVFSFEGMSTTQTVNPDTGKEWEPGEQQEYANKHGYGDVVTECLVTTVVSRHEKKHVGISQGYVQEDAKVLWLEPDILESYDSTQGVIPDTLRRIMEVPKLGDEIPVEIMKQVHQDLGGERARFHQDVAIMRVLGDEQLVVGAMLQAQKGSLRQQLIEERFGSMQ
jgi:hypothetical protein